MEKEKEHANCKDGTDKQICLVILAHRQKRWAPSLAWWPAFLCTPRSIFNTSKTCCKYPSCKSPMCRCQVPTAPRDLFFFFFLKNQAFKAKLTAQTFTFINACYWKCNVLLEHLAADELVNVYDDLTVSYTIFSFVAECLHFLMHIQREKNLATF